MIQKDILQIGAKNFNNRLMVGTGKYQSPKIMIDSLENSKSEIITVAIRRIKNIDKNENLLQQINWSKYWMLPNTAGCKTSEEAIRIALLGRELAKLSGQEDNLASSLPSSAILIASSQVLQPAVLGNIQYCDQLICCSKLEFLSIFLILLIATVMISDFELSKLSTIS